MMPIQNCSSGVGPGFNQGPLNVSTGVGGYHQPVGHFMPASPAPLREREFHNESPRTDFMSGAKKKWDSILDDRGPDVIAPKLTIPESSPAIDYIGFVRKQESARSKLLTDCTYNLTKNLGSHFDHLKKKEEYSWMKESLFDTKKDDNAFNALRIYKLPVIEPEPIIPLQPIKLPSLDEELFKTPSWKEKYNDGFGLLKTNDFKLPYNQYSSIKERASITSGLYNTDNSSSLLRESWKETLGLNNSSNDYSSNDYSSNDYSSNDYSSNDYLHSNRSGSGLKTYVTPTPTKKLTFGEQVASLLVSP